ncbi:MAG: class II aldolase/adducin family protein [Deltaproteobacteria bacterium]|nr:class II aldolase/adducin family protein [Deltaproteobacteria bacterium]
MNAPQTDTALPPVDRNTPECREIKAKLAAGFRILARRRMDDGIAGHISCRVPGAVDEFWVNPLGLFFEEVTADDLIVVNHQGHVVDGDRPYNQAAFAIHATIHAARPDVMAVCHTHPPKGTAFAALGRPIKIIDQTACSFHDDHVLVPEYEGVVADKGMAESMARALGTRRVAVLQNHGLITLGRSVEQAIIDMLDLERTCELNLAVLARWDEVIEVPAAVALQAREVFTSFGRLYLQWEGLVRQVERH